VSLKLAFWQGEVGAKTDAWRLEYGGSALSNIAAHDVEVDLRAALSLLGHKEQFDLLANRQKV
jgi:hypothetical protein